jgi:hypothetical protein
VTRQCKPEDDISGIPDAAMLKAWPLLHYDASASLAQREYNGNKAD